MRLRARDSYSVCVFNSWQPFVRWCCVRACWAEWVGHLLYIWWHVTVAPSSLHGVWLLTAECRITSTSEFSHVCVTVVPFPYVQIFPSFLHHWCHFAPLHFRGFITFPPLIGGPVWETVLQHFWLCKVRSTCCAINSRVDISLSSVYCPTFIPRAFI